MTRRNTFIASIAFATLTVGTLAPAFAAENQDVIDYRQRIMRTLDAQVAALGQILSGATPDDQVVSHLETIAEAAAQSLKSFEPKVEGGESLPVVWTKWDDFSAKMKDFQQKTRAAADTAKAQGKDAALTNILDALRCKDCHDIYRKKQ
ncbi:MAG: cytochrome c [Rhodospirillaceae bacterium]